MFTAMHCEGFENEEVALDRLHILPMGAERHDLEDLQDDHEYEPPHHHTAEVLDFELVLNKVRSLVYSVGLSDTRRRTLERHCVPTNVSYRVPTLDRLGRWNSTHDMLDNIRHLERPLRLLSLDDRRLERWWPTAHEWDMIKRFKKS
jgi:hypothetical protein